MSKIKLIPNPTFSVAVAIPVAGSEPINVTFEFRHRTRDELEKLTATMAAMQDVDYILHIASGWELKEKWTKDNVATLLNHYHGAARAIARKYVHELTGTPIAE